MSRTEIPIHPEFTRALRKIHEANPAKVPAARTVFKRANNALITNYDTHTSEATIPFTRLSTDELDLPPNLFRRHTPSGNETPSEQILALGEGKQIKVVLLPGFAFPPSGTPLDNERVSRMINLVGHAAAKGQEIEIFATGLAISRGGNVTKDWPAKLGQNGFQEHGLTSADFLQTHVLPKTQAEKNETVVVLLGESMGCYNARETAKTLGDTGIESYLYLKNPPGPEGVQSPLLKKAQVILGYGMESGIRRLTTSFARKGTPSGREDNAFFEQISDYLATEKNMQPDDKQQRRLKWRATLTDARNLLTELPFSLDGIDLPATLDYGVKDPTSFTLQRLKEWHSGITHSVKGKTIRVLDQHAHTPQHDIWEWAHKLR